MDIRLAQRLRQRLAGDMARAPNLHARPLQLARELVKLRLVGVVLELVPMVRAEDLHPEFPGLFRQLSRRF